MMSIMLNAIVGAMVCAMADTKDEIFYQWYKEAPSIGGIVQFIILTFWPAMLFFMIRYRISITTREQ
jgi:hypothetical protein